MSDSRLILVLHEPGDSPPGLDSFVDALKDQGARVELMACGEPYVEVLRAVARADAVVFWR